MKKTIGKYRIEYQNGMVQECDMVSQAAYRNVIVPTKDRIQHLLSTNNHIDTHMAGRLKKTLKEWYGDNYFTSESPMADAIYTGLLVLPENQGGTKSISVTQIKSTTHD